MHMGKTLRAKTVSWPVYIAAHVNIALRRGSHCRLRWAARERGVLRSGGRWLQLHSCTFTFSQINTGFRAGLRYCVNSGHSGPRVFLPNHAPGVDGDGIFYFNFLCSHPICSLVLTSLKTFTRPYMLPLDLCPNSHMVILALITLYNKVLYVNICRMLS